MDGYMFSGFINAKGINFLAIFDLCRRGCLMKMIRGQQMVILLLQPQEELHQDIDRTMHIDVFYSFDMLT